MSCNDPNCNKCTPDPKSGAQKETIPAARSYSVSLSRTGGQGSKGDSVTNAELRGSDVIFEITQGDGSVYEINAGSLNNEFSIDNLFDIALTDPQEGDTLLYDEIDNKFRNHSFTTSNLKDVDNTNREDGAVLIYDEIVGKYVATNKIEKPTTNIIGGSF